MTKKIGLGRNLNDLGLNALLSDTPPTPRQAIHQIAIELLQPGKYQPRQEFTQATLEELATSIKAHGIIQPILVRELNNTYEIIAGERRWRAAQLAGLPEIPVMIRDLTDEQAIALALIENLQREDLNALDTAIGLKRLIDEFAMTHDSLAKAIGKSRTTITNLLRLLALHPEVKILLQQGLLEMGHARALLSLPPTQQLAVAKIITTKHLSVRATENYMHQLQTPTATKKTRDPNTLSLQKRLQNVLGAKVTIQHTNSGKGKLVIHYHSLDELDNLITKIT